MKTMFAVILGAAVLCSPAAARASGGVGASVGSGMVFVGDGVERADTSLEVLLFYKFMMVKADLGILMDMEQVDQLVQVRPGVRISLPMVYLRGAIPINVHGPTDWGFLAGIGMDISLANTIGAFAELDTTIYGSRSPADYLPLEGRVGLELIF